MYVTFSFQMCLLAPLLHNNHVLMSLSCSGHIIHSHYDPRKQVRMSQ